VSGSKRINRPYLFVIIFYTPALLGNPVVARVSRAKEFAADTAAATALNSQLQTTCPP